MRWLARAALAALGSFSSVFIACAYGTPWRYTKSGHVLDAGTKQGIPGIQVACVDAASIVMRQTMTGASGRFELGLDVECDALAFTDVDGAENGAYAAASLPFASDDEPDLVVELTPAP